MVESRPNLCDPKAGPTLEDGEWSLREFVPGRLAAHVVHHLGDSRRSTKTRLATALRQLQEDSEIEIQPTDDHVCSKAFDSPLTLPTITALDIFTKWLFKDLEPADHVYISCETGEWLLTNKAMKKLLSEQHHVEVITAFGLKSGDLDKAYKGKLEVATHNPWRHNRHMTIVCKGDSPSRAVYFARRLRTPLITPVYLKNPEDAARIMRTFNLMREEIDATKPREDAEHEADEIVVRDVTVQRRGVLKNGNVTDSVGPQGN